jgi:hypothetical protein
MNLDFRKLSKAQQVEAINEVLTHPNYGPEFLAYLIAKGSYDVYGWFPFDATEKGSDYWINLRYELLSKEN